MIRKAVWGGTKSDPTKIDAGLLKQLRQLCHPDKHNGSELSRKVWDKLEEARKALDIVSGKNI